MFTVGDQVRFDPASDKWHYDVDPECVGEIGTVKNIHEGCQPGCSVYFDRICLRQWCHLDDLEPVSFPVDEPFQGDAGDECDNVCCTCDEIPDLVISTCDGEDLAEYPAGTIAAVTVSQDKDLIVRFTEGGLEYFPRGHYGTFLLSDSKLLLTFRT